MTLNNSTAHRMTIAAVIAVLTLAPMTSATGWAGQRRGSGAASGGDGGRGSRGGGGTAVPREGGGGARSGGDSGGRGTAVTPGDRSGRGDRGAGADGGASRGGRTRDDQPVEGRAVPRRGDGGSGGGTTIIVPGGGYYGGGYYGGWPLWGFGGLGWGGYYGGFYDPYYWGGSDYYGSGYYGSYGAYQGYGGDPEGALRLRVKPHQASVFVDGYYAGEVDQFDGVFQRLRLESGPHRIEISADGYEPLTFEIRVLPDRTTTYKGELTRTE